MPGAGCSEEAAEAKRHTNNMPPSRRVPVGLGRSETRIGKPLIDQLIPDEDRFRNPVILVEVFNLNVAPAWRTTKASLAMHGWVVCGHATALPPEALSHGVLSTGI